jgi:small subunit ribosomal protein S18
MTTEEATRPEESNGVAVEQRPVAGPGPSGPPPGPGGAPRPRRDRARYGRRRVCTFCAEHIKLIDYKDVERLRRFLSDRAKIEPRRKTGTCAKHQRRLALALKRARHLALVPYAVGHIRISGGVGVRGEISR